MPLSPAPPSMTTEEKLGLGVLVVQWQVGRGCKHSSERYTYTASQLQLETKVIHWVNACLTSVLNVKVLIRSFLAFNQEKVLVGAFTMIVKSSGTFG